MRHLIYILWVLLLTSCGTTYQLSTLNNNDPIYGIVESTGDTLKIDVIDNEFQLDRKFRFDDKFRWDFAQYAMNQDLRWHYDFYWNNRMYRSPFASPFDFYWNSHQYWWNWSSNYSFNYGFNHWNRFGFYGFNHWNRYDSWRWGYGHPFYNNGWRNQMNDYAWENRNRRNVAYVNGRRGSNNVVTSNGNRRGSTNNVLSNPNIRINRGRPSIPPTLDNEDLVIKDKQNSIDRLVRKIENSSGIRVRTYENPNNVPNNNNRIRNYNRVENGNNNVNRNNNNNIRNYNRPPVNNNRPSRSYTPPSRSSNPPVINRGSSSGRSSGGAVISRGSSGKLNN